MRESSIERKVIEAVQGLVPSLKLNVQGNTGYPDRLFLIPGGRPLFIEFKQPGGKPRPKQAHIHKELRRLGYDVEVHDDVEKATKAVVDACLAGVRRK